MAQMCDWRKPIHVAVPNITMFRGNADCSRDIDESTQQERTANLLLRFMKQVGAVSPRLSPNDGRGARQPFDFFASPQRDVGVELR